MPKIRVIVATEEGQSTEQLFVLPANLETLDAIDEAVEAIKNQALPRALALLTVAKLNARCTAQA